MDSVGDFRDTINSTYLESFGNDKSHGAKKGCTGNCKDKIHSVGTNNIGNIDSAVRRGKRERKEPERLGYFIGESSIDEKFALSAEDYVENEPQSIEEARKRDDWHEWKRAIESEYDSLLKNSTWVLCDLPKNRKAISNK